MITIQLTIYKFLGMIDTPMNKAQLLCNSNVWSPEISALEYYEKSQIEISMRNTDFEMIHFRLI